MEDKKRKRQKTAVVEQGPSVLQPVLDQLKTARHLLEKITQSKDVSEDHLLSQIRSELKTFQRLVASHLPIKYEFHLSALLQIDGGYWHDILAVHDVLSLALCNKTVFSLLCPIISARNNFKQHPGSKFKFYSPKRLTHVSDLKDLPVYAQHLVFDKDFYKPVDKLPPSVASLRFEGWYEYDITKLPATITSLDFRSGHPSIIKFSAALTHLSFSHSEYLREPPSLPHSITHLNIPNSDTALPPHLHTLEISNPCKFLNNLPPSLKVLHLRGCSGSEFQNRSKTFNIQLPASLTQVTFWLTYDQPLCKLPSTLTHLNLPGRFNQPIDSLPLALTHLTVGDKFNQPVDCLPASLTHLTFGEKFNQSVDLLPPSLSCLTFGYRFNQPVDRLPAKLRSLYLGSKFKKPLRNLPQLTRLSFKQQVKLAPATDALPTSITRLNFGVAATDQNGIPPPSPRAYPHVPLPTSIQHVSFSVWDSAEMILSVPEATGTVTFAASQNGVSSDPEVAFVLVDFDARMILFKYKEQREQQVQRHTFSDTERNRDSGSESEEDE